MTRDEVVAAAARSLGRHGYRGTTLRGLAEELGVSLGTIQHHVASKEALWRAVVDEVIVERLGRAREVTAAAVPRGAEATFAALLRSRLVDAMSTPGLLAMTQGGDAAEDDGRLAYLRSAVQPFRDDGVAMFREGQRAGVVSDTDPTAFLALVNLGLVSVVSSPDALRAFFDIDLDDENQRERLLDGLIDLLLHGLLPRP